MEASSGATKLDFNNSLFRFPETLNGSGLRVGQRLQSSSGQSGAVRELNLEQIVEEVSAIRGVLPALCCLSLLLAGVVAAF